MELKVITASRKRRKSQSSSENLRKKIKLEKEEKDNSATNLLIPIEVIEQRMNAIIKTAVTIFHDLDDQPNRDTKEKIAYLDILRKLCYFSYWSHNRIISSQIQQQIISQKQKLTKNDCKEVNESVNQWMRFKRSQLLVNFKGNKNELIANHFRQTISSYGVQYETIEDKIKQFSPANGRFRSNSKSSVSNTSSLSTLSTTTSSRYQSSCSNTENIGVCGSCRLCGNTNARLIINIYRNVNKNTTFKDLIEYYCRVKLEDNESLSQLICVECKISIETFTRFCDKLDSYQEKLKQQLVQETSIQIKDEPVETNLSIDPVNNSTTITSFSPPSQLRIQMVESITPLPETQLSPMSNIFCFNDINDPFRDLNEITTPTLTTQKNKEYDASTDNESNDVDDSEEEDDNLPPIIRESMQTLLTRCNACSVPLYKLPIVFVPSDTESDSEDSISSEIRKKNNNLENSLKEMAYNLEITRDA